MDGLLFDSERVGCEVIAECGKMQGVQIAPEFILGTLGMTDTVSKPLYRKTYPGIDPDRLFADFVTVMRGKAVKKEIPLKKGALELLERLKELEIPCALASSSQLESVQAYIDGKGITGYFSAVLGAPKNVRSKPEPDIFILAAGMLGRKPEECMVLEDSVNGIRAGHACGAYTVMVPDLIPFREELRPYTDRVCESLEQVRKECFE